MAVMVPPTFPHDLRRRPELAGEKIAYDALAAALDDTWTVHYNQHVKGSRRPIDFLILLPDGGQIAWEVKGGLVHAHQGAFRPRIARNGLRKRIDPFAQLKRAVAAHLAATRQDAATPVHMAIVFPQMSLSAFPWPPSLHMLSRETLEPQNLHTWFAALAKP